MTELEKKARELAQKIYDDLFSAEFVAKCEADVAMGKAATEVHKYVMLERLTELIRPDLESEVERTVREIAAWLKEYSPRRSDVLTEAADELLAKYSLSPEKEK